MLKEMVFIGNTGSRRNTEKDRTQSLRNSKSNLQLSTGRKEKVSLNSSSNKKA